MHLLLLNGTKHIITVFSDIFNLFLNKSKFVMNTSLPDIYNNLNNYHDKEAFTSTSFSRSKQKIFYYFILKSK
jgi:hypothetical protein